MTSSVCRLCSVLEVSGFRDYHRAWMLLADSAVIESFVLLLGTFTYISVNNPGKTYWFSKLDICDICLFVNRKSFKQHSVSFELRDLLNVLESNLLIADDIITIVTTVLLKSPCLYLYIDVFSQIFSHNFRVLGFMLLFLIHMECPCYSCYCCDETLTKARWGGKMLFDLYLYIIIHYWKTSGQKLEHDRILEPGDLTEAVEVCCVLDCCAWLIHPAFLENPGSAAKNGTTHNGMEIPSQSLIKKMQYSQILWKHFLSWGSILSEDSRLYQTDLKLAGKRILSLCDGRYEKPVSLFYITVCSFPNIICWRACLSISGRVFFFLTLCWNHMAVAACVYIWVYLCMYLYARIMLCYLLQLWDIT